MLSFKYTLPLIFLLDNQILTIEKNIIRDSIKNDNCINLNINIV